MHVNLVHSHLDHLADKVGYEFVFIRRNLKRFSQPRHVKRAIANVPILGQQLVDAHRVGAGHVADLLQLVRRELRLQACHVLDDFWRK